MIPAKFNYLREYTLEELEKEQREVEDDAECCLCIIDSRDSNSEARSEAYRDLGYDREKLDVLGTLIEEKKSAKKM